jgi:DNA-directed RNA polymerase specialized sigma24 family protein
MPFATGKMVLSCDPVTLVGRIREGDSAAEDELVRFFEREVLGSLRRRMRDHDVARELANDVLISVVCALRAGRLQDAEKLRAFVRGTARNLANNYIRSRLARRLALVYRALAGLGGRDRQILLLTMVEGLKPRQIAQGLGLSPEVVRTRKSRALKRLLEGTRRRDA